jgi:hypothetical protein
MSERGLSANNAVQGEGSPSLPERERAMATRKNPARTTRVAYVAPLARRATARAAAAR